MLQSYPIVRSTRARISRVFHGNQLAFSSSSSKGIKKQNAFFAWYTRQIDTYPLVTKCITAGIVSGVGDMTSQALQKHGERKSILDLIDFQQTARFVFMNVTFVGPTLHYWYQWLGRMWPGTSVTSVAKRVFIDEILFTPIYYPVFLSCIWKLEHGNSLSFSKIASMLYQELPTLIVAEWVLYVPAQSVNFRYVPGKFQVLFSNVIGIVWNTFLSFTANNAHGKHENSSLQQQDNAEPEAVMAGELNDSKALGVSALSRKMTQGVHEVR